MPYLLFVDDDSNVLNINRNYFESRGFSVSVAQTADQALDHVKKYPVDCVVLDIMMPGFDGFLLCRRFKTQMTAPVIFLTSLTEKEYLYQGFSLGGDDFLTKPWDLKELEMRIRTRISQCSNRSLKGERLEFPPLTIDAGTRQASIGTYYCCWPVLRAMSFPRTPFTVRSGNCLIWTTPRPSRCMWPVCGIKWKLPARDTASSEPCGSRGTVSCRKTAESNRERR